MLPKAGKASCKWAVVPRRNAQTTKSLKVSWLRLRRAAPGPTSQRRRDPEPWKSSYPFGSGYLTVVRAGHGTPGPGGQLEEVLREPGGLNE